MRAHIYRFSYLSYLGPWANGHIRFSYQKTAARISLTYSETSNRKDLLQTSLTKHKMPKLVEFIFPPSVAPPRGGSGKGHCDSPPLHPPSLGLLFVPRYTGEGLRVWNYWVTEAANSKDKSNYARAGPNVAFHLRPHKAGRGTPLRRSYKVTFD